MPGLVDRYAPDDPFRRLALAVALVTLGVPTAFYGFFAIWWPIQLWLYVGQVQSVFVMLAGLAAVLWGRDLLRDVAGQATEADSTDERVSETDEATDPVATLKRRYAAGDLTEEEFDRRLERLLESDEERGSETLLE